MLQFFRNIFKTRIGLAVTIAFIGLLGLAFVVADVSGTGAPGGISGGDTVAVVGGDKVGSSELSQAADTALDQIRAQNPTMSMEAFVQQGGLTDVLNQLLDRKAISIWAEKNGLGAGTNLVNSEIRRIPAFAGADGTFNDTAYQQLLASRGLTDAMVRRDLADSLLAQQALVPVAFGARMPSKIALRYAALARERREGAVAVIPSSAFVPASDPTAAELNTFYNANKADFIRPERRVLRYATFDASALGNITPSESEIAARYARDRASEYAARETRTLTQLIVPTQQAAQAIASRGPGALEAAAREAGLETRKIEGVERGAYAGQSSQAVAQAVFGTAKGAIARPTRGGLGWYVVRVDNVSAIPARSLDQVRGAIAATLTEEKRTRALSELAAEVEQQIDEGNALTDIAGSLKVNLQTTAPLVGDGRVYGSATERAPEVLAPALASAFEMEEGQPQIAAMPGGQSYLVFETSRITPSAAAPLAEIRDDVVAAWRRSVGSRAAKAAADRIVARMAKGQSLQAAIDAETAAIPAPQQVSMSRQELASQGQRVPPPLALLFSMAQNSVKRLEAPNDIGWYVIELDSIRPGAITPGDPVVAQASASLSQLLGREYGDAMRAAIRKDVGIERNADAVEAVRKRLVGAN
ncbi:peptidylprolyl isomerase [Altererythrobacter aerius]|uniref:Peptidylprolyl isomerase n=1 Tax=Tsuneonella aeria TaxID=1837929 RepID=A0A6I4TBF8_9SPHN|nr:peptidylprolyl isomerase [Tsuneonella aeria]MXO74094.1 peptidylprolyl isomerase [Tsuneonella aeria]